MAKAGVQNAVVTMLSIAAAGVVVFPEYVSDRLGSPGEAGISGMLSVTTLLRLLHLLSFSISFGTALWVSFIGGIIMFKNLPRHQFGNLQGHLFPAYFRLNTSCLAACLAVFGLLHPWSSSSPWEKVQVGSLGTATLFFVGNLLILEPITTQLMRQRHKAEKEDGIETDAGVSRKAEIEKAGPKLRAINKKFFAAHGISSLINLLAFFALILHSTYLGTRLLV